MANNVGLHPGAAAIGSNKQKLPERKNIRATFHDYSGGDYFVTICTADKRHFFGEIRNGEMSYTTIGMEAFRCMETLASHYSYVNVSLFVVMPIMFMLSFVSGSRRMHPGASLQFGLRLELL